MEEKIRKTLLYIIVGMLILALSGTAGAAMLIEDCEEGLSQEAVEIPAAAKTAGEVLEVGEIEIEIEEKDTLKPPYPEEMILINPLYDDIYTEEDILSQLEYTPPQLYASSGQTRKTEYLDRKKAIEVFREHLKNRDGSFTISLKASNYSEPR